MSEDMVGLASLFERPLSRDATAPVDGLRALAFLWIFQVHLLATLFIHSPVYRLKEYFHREPIYSEVVMRGHFAVDIFNILSCFLATSSLLRTLTPKGMAGARATATAVSRYVRRRILRVIPANHGFLLLMGLISLVEHIPGRQNLWTNFIFVNNYVPFQDQFMPHTWTQALEIQWSILYPPVLLLGVKLWCQKPLPPSTVLKAAAVALTIGVMIRGILALHIAHNTSDGLHIPLPLHTLDWLHATMPASTSAFYRVLYCPLWTRFTSFICGAVLAWAQHHHRLFAPNGPFLECTTRRLAGAMLSMALALWPRLTSHDADPSYAPVLSAVWLSLGRVLFAVPITLLLYWCLNFKLQYRTSLDLTKTRLTEPLRDPRLRHRAAASQRGTHAETGVTKVIEETPNGSSALPMPPFILEVVNTVLCWWGWYPIASVSYVAYLVHVPVIGGIAAGLASERPLSLALIVWRLLVPSLFVTLLISAALHVYVERPIVAHLK